MATTVNKIIKQAQSWVGKKEADGSFKEIIDTYNAHKPLARGYKMKYTDHWCATFISALFIKCGATDILPIECGCEPMINLCKSKGIWVENENRKPNVGDIVFYDWADGTNYKTTDNKGWSDHVGIVESVNGNKFTVIEGNMSERVGRRTLEVNARYLRGFAVPKYTKTAASTAASKVKTTLELAQEVLAGKHGVGEARKKSLGSRYAEVQAKVNELLKKPAKKDLNAVAKQVYNGAFGNGQARIVNLKAKGYTDAEIKQIQSIVNKMCK